MAFNENMVDQEEKNEELIIKLKKQVAVGVWLQFTGHLIELLGLYELLQLNGEISEGDIQIVSGSLIGTIGDLVEAIAVTSQILTKDKERLIDEQKLAITGDSLVSLGSAFEAIGGMKVLEKEKAGQHTRLVP
ncbi:hypothetical protein [Heyndrickxia acidiproducens]|uniref:hypothetical protein n=1 Tax=Heyndrickxia acidiproducens TaxID=1121084 RepID=UPI0003692D11|nr:hypothetical protein [Heyndrickxia acidiproducens]